MWCKSSLYLWCCCFWIISISPCASLSPQHLFHFVLHSFTSHVVSPSTESKSALLLDTCTTHPNLPPFHHLFPFFCTLILTSLHQFLSLTHVCLILSRLVWLTYSFATLPCVACPVSPLSLTCRTFISDQTTFSPNLAASLQQTCRLETLTSAQTPPLNTFKSNAGAVEPKWIQLNISSS